jgi:hypothetical protein
LKNERRNRRKHKKTQNGLQRLQLFLTSKLSLISKGNHLLDQIKVFKVGAPNLQGTIPKYANDKRQALVDAVELYEEGVWVTGSAEDWESESEEFSFEDIDNDTSDTDID